MLNALFVVTLGLLFALPLSWAFRTLPRERWQIMATVPISRSVTGRWIGANFTFYGLLVASASTIGFLTYLLLLASAGISLAVAVGAAGLIMSCGLPAASWVARLVEGKRTTLTVSGSFIVSLLVSPIAIWFSVWAFGQRGESMGELLVPMVAALAVGTALGEGLGRLACLSFGCCYGRPLSELPGWVQRIFQRFSVSFTGPMKKIAYASNMEGVAVFPVQALTVMVSTLIGLAGIFLYLEGHHVAALLLSVIGNQSWRIFSETLRADYRGPGSFTIYQQFGVVGILFSVALAFLYPAPVNAQPDLVQGLKAMWSPWVILLAQLVGSVVFVYCGRSDVTASVISMHVVDDA